jgi:hypothetical protein
MEHPLLPNLDDLTTEQLGEKLSELNKKLSIAYRIGNHHLCNQIRMAIESYQNKLTEKNRKAPGGEDFGNIINIS